MTPQILRSDQSSYAIALDQFVIAPNDGADLATRPDGLYVGTAGNLVVSNDAGATSETYVDVSGFLPISPLRVMATGTTAADILGLVI